MTLERTKPRPVEGFFEGLVKVAGLGTMALVVLICLYLVKEAWGLAALGYPLGELFTTGWYPISHPPRFGLLPLLVGTGLVTATAVLVAFPLGLGTATYLAEWAPARVREVLKPAIELSAAVPSVVMGFFGLKVLGPFVQETFGLASGQAALTGAIALSLMALPTIVTIADDALRAVPKSYREGALALGADRWQTIARVVWPAAGPGLVAALILGFGRVVGETMAVLMLTGNAAQMTPSLLKPVRTMTATIAAEMGDAVQGSLHYHALFAVGLTLFAITIVVNALAAYVLARARKRLGSA